MNEQLINHKIDIHENRLNNHAERIDKMEQADVEMKTEIKNLCKSIEGLTSTMKWLLCLFGTSLLGFFFYVVQSLIK